MFSRLRLLGKWFLNLLDKELKTHICFQTRCWCHQEDNICRSLQYHQCLIKKVVGQLKSEAFKKGEAWGYVEDVTFSTDEDATNETKEWKPSFSLRNVKRRGIERGGSEHES